MRTKDKHKESLPKTNIKSTMKISWLYSEEIEKTINSLSDFLEKELVKLYKLNYMDFTSKWIKIKVDDDDKFIHKTVNCLFVSNKTDEKYWNTRVELTFTEISKKPRYSLVWKFSVKDYETINKSTLKEIIKWLDEIYE